MNRSRSNLRWMAVLGWAVVAMDDVTTLVRVPGPWTGWVAVALTAVALIATVVLVRRDYIAELTAVAAHSESLDEHADDTLRAIFRTEQDEDAA